MLLYVETTFMRYRHGPGGIGVNHVYLIMITIDEIGNIGNSLKLALTGETHFRLKLLM